MKLTLALTAAVVLTGPGTPYHDGWPPRRYIGEAKAMVHFAPRDRLQMLCADGNPVPKGREYVGCLRGGVIYCPVPQQGGEAVFARCVAHELAHRKLWPREHPL